MKTVHYLCNFWGLVEPQIVAGPFEKEVPDSAYIQALKETHIERDLLFGLTVRDGVPSLWTYTGGYADEMREKAKEGECLKSPGT